MKKVIQFTKVRKLTYTLSLLALAAMFVVTFVVHKGFNLGIDFQPGVSIQAVVQGAESHIDQVRSSLSGFESVQVQSFSSQEGSGYVIRVRNPENKDNYAKEVETGVRSAMAQTFGAANVKVGSTDGLSTSSIGARFSQTLTQQAFLLVLLSLVFIGIYVWIRFKLGFAIGAITATLHDAVFMIAFIGAAGMEVTSSTIAAILTIIGYSLNDTIVVFDRIRENEKIMAEQKLSHTYDLSITATLSRTIVTSLTVLISSVAIAVFTQGEVRDFGIALIVGVVIGTYSSIFIASPVLLDFRTAQNRRKAKKEAANAAAGVEVAKDYDGDTPVTTSEVDADALAEEIRKTRASKKKI